MHLCAIVCNCVQLCAVVCICVHLCAFVRSCVQLCAFVCNCVHLSTFVRSCVQLCAFVCSCAHLCAIVCICVHLCAFVYNNYPVFRLLTFAVPWLLWEGCPGQHKRRRRELPQGCVCCSGFMLYLLDLCCAGFMLLSVLYGDVCFIRWAGQSCIYTLYMTVSSVIYLPKILYIHRIYMHGFGQPSLPYCAGLILLSVLYGDVSLIHWHSWLYAAWKRKGINYEGSEKPLPTLIKKSGHFGTEYCKTPSPKEGHDNISSVAVFIAKWRRIRGNLRQLVISNLLWRMNHMNIFGSFWSAIIQHISCYKRHSNTKWHVNHMNFSGSFSGAYKVSII